MRQRAAIVVNLGFYILHSGFVQANKSCQLSNRVMCSKKIKTPHVLLSFVLSLDITKGRVQSMDIRADIFFNELMDEKKAISFFVIGVVIREKYCFAMKDMSYIDNSSVLIKSRRTLPRECRALNSLKRVTFLLPLT